MKSRLSRITTLSLAMLFGLGLAMPLATVAAPPATFQPCDIFTGAGQGGQINWYRPNTCPGVPSSVSLMGTLNPGAAGSGNTFITGMAFDVSGGCQTVGSPCLYATSFGSNSIYVYDVTGAYIGTCGALGGADPNGNSDIESVTIVPSFSGGPSLFFGQADGDRQILQYPLPCNSSSTPTAAFTACTASTGTCPAGSSVNRGTDWVDMTSNNCDIQYTSESTSILDFNVCTNTQGSDFTDSLPSSSLAYAHRQLSSGAVIVGATDRVVSLDSGGSIINSCLVGSEPSGTLFSMDILPDQNSFAVAPIGGDNNVMYETVAHCNAGQATADFAFAGLTSSQVNSGAEIGGVAIYGEFTASNPPHGVPQFGAPMVAVAAMGAVIVALLRRTRLPRLAA